MISTPCIPFAIASPRSLRVRSSRQDRSRRCSLRNIRGSRLISAASGHASCTEANNGADLPMETRASHVLIGTFTLAAIAAAFGFVYWFSNPSQGIARATYRVAFAGSVSGLRAGASVLFNGIRVGEVTDLRLNPEDPRQVVATIGIDHAVPIRADTQ